MTPDPARLAPPGGARSTPPRGPRPTRRPAGGCGGTAATSCSPAIPTRPLDAAARDGVPRPAVRALRPGAAVRGRARAAPSRAGWSCRPPTDGVVPLDRIGTVSLGRPRRHRRLVARRVRRRGVPARCATAARARRPTAAAATCSTPSRAPTWAATATGWWSTSTSPTTRPAPTTRAGRAPWRPRATGSSAPVAAGRAAAPRRLVLT